TLSMFIARIVFFRLHESPRYLVHAGRHQEAIESLQLISRFNGSEMSLEIGDVQDQHPPVATAESGTLTTPIPRKHQKSNDIRPRPTSTTVFSATDIDGEASHEPSPTSTVPPSTTRPALVTQYNSTDAMDNRLEGHTFSTPSQEHAPVFSGTTSLPQYEEGVEDTESKPPSPVHSRRDFAAVGEATAVGMVGSRDDGLVAGVAADDAIGVGGMVCYVSW
ncbi:hypothetical protein C0991_005496, partial [Blastosporella zonata]